jgi:hypothetical protein
MRGFVIQGEGGKRGEGQSCLFPGDLSPIG